MRPPHPRSWVVLLVLCALAACRSTTAAKPAEPPKEAAPAAAPPAAPGSPAAATVPAAAEPSSGAEPDYWYDRFQGYMTDELRRRYLATPRDDRFRLFGDKLLEFQRRDALLDRYERKLAGPDLEAYQKLPDVESSERFLRERFPNK